MPKDHNQSMQLMQCKHITTTANATINKTIQLKFPENVTIDNIHRKQRQKKQAKATTHVGSIEFMI